MNAIVRCCLLLSVPAIVVSQGTSTGVGALKLPYHAAAAAQGDASVSSAGSIAAVQFNPATLFGPEDRLAVLFTHTSWIQDVQGQHLSVTLPLPFGQGLLSVGSSSVQDIELRQTPGPAEGTFTAQTGLLSAGWAGPLGSGIVGGISASYVYEKIYVHEATGVAWSFGAVGKLPIADLTAGVSLTNLGRMSVLRSSRSDLPQAVRLGVSTTYESGLFRFEPSVALRQYTGPGVTTIHAAIACTYDGLVTVRTHWQSGDGASALGGGLGATWHGVGLEYAVLPFTEGFGTAQLLSISLEL